MMKNRWLKILVLSIYALVFSEIFVQVMNPQALVPRYVTAGPDGIRMNIPNAVYRHKTPEVNVEMRINSQGIRSDKEFLPGKRPDTYRIVLLGDSFFMGYEVDLEDSVAWLLERNLLSHGVNAEVINLAVSGFGTAENLVALRERGRVFEPDLVIMQWHQTDPADNLRSNLFGVLDGRLIERNAQYLPGVATRDRLMQVPGYEWLITNSHLYNLIRGKLSMWAKELLLQRSKRANVANKTQSPENSLTLKNLDELLILAVKKEAEQQGANLLVFDVPRRANRTEFKSAFDELNLALLKGTIMVSPVTLFTAKGGPEVKLYTEKGHGHWTELGNRLVANLLTDKVLEVYRAK